MVTMWSVQWMLVPIQRSKRQATTMPLDLPEAGMKVYSKPEPNMLFTKESSTTESFVSYKQAMETRSCNTKLATTLRRAWEPRPQTFQHIIGSLFIDNQFFMT
jgi:hypothetical protein